jgi:hypothetical protein
MEKKWTEMTPEEKRAVRLNKVLLAEGVKFPTPEAEARYKAKAQRIINAYNLKESDRVPVRLGGGFFPASFANISGKELIYDAEKITMAFTKILREFDADIVAANPPLPGKALETLEFKLYKWPGYGLEDHILSHQYEEGEYMKADEYDDFIEDPTDFWLRKYMPRIFGKLAPLANLARLTEIYEIPVRHIALFGRPDVQDALKSLMKAGDEMAEMRESLSGLHKEVIAQGFPSFMAGFAKAPLDIIGDTLRGTMAVMMDLFRRPDKLKAAMERLVPITIKGAVEAANASGCPVIMIPLHKGADGFMSEKQFAELYWPTLRAVIMGMVEEGLLPQLFAEGSYNTRLEIIKDLPRCSVTWFFDQTDMGKAKKILGSNTCVEGNIPVSLLSSGTPAEVTAYCRKLIETCAPGGGFILAGGASNDNGNPENLRAMMDAAKEFGVY